MSQQAPDGRERETLPQPPEVTWVGQQWRMDGYCGRATPAPTPPADEAPAPGVEVRPVAVVRTRRRSQGRVVRIGPRKETPAA